MPKVSRSTPINVYSTVSISIPKSSIILDIVPDFYDNKSICIIYECDAEDIEYRNIEIMRLYYNYVIPDRAKYLGTITRDDMEVYYYRET